MTEIVLSRTLRRGIGTVFHCGRCDLGFLIGKPVDASHYNGPYRQQASHKASGSPTNPQEIFDTYGQYQNARIELIAEHFEVRPGNSMLELGASAGQFLSHYDPGIRRCAIEPDEACCAFMDKMGIETDHRTLFESKFAHVSFDIVCAFQVLEHTSDPVAFLHEVRSVLRAGGRAVVEVPNLHEGLREIPEYSKFYYHADHLFYFSERSLRRAAQLAGFKESKILFTQDYNVLNALSWAMTRAPQPDCHIGLSPVNLGFGSLGKWLTHQMMRVNLEYVAWLKRMGKTSNLTLVLTGE